MQEFNVIEPIGSIFENRFKKEKEKLSLGRPTSKLVELVCYCLNPNHYHFLLEQLVDNGISEFLKRLNGGYTKFYNTKYKRSGSLFQGRFKDVHIATDKYLMHGSVYVNLNDKIHLLGRPTSKLPKLVKSSWDEYMRAKIIKDKNGNNKLVENSGDVCKKDIILERFNSVKEYEELAMDTLQGILERRHNVSELEL